MNNQGFQKVFLLLIGFVVLVLGYIFLTVEPKNKETLKALHNQVDGSQTHASTAVSVVKTTLPDNNSTTPANLTDDQLTVLLDELQPHQYHQDPFIEARTISILFALCSKEFGGGQIVKFKLAENNQDAVIKDFTNDCDQVKLRYPRLLSFDQNDSLLKLIPSNTDLGKLIKQGYADYDQNYPQIYRVSAGKKLTAALKSKNAALLAEESMSAFMHFQHGETLPVSRWLNSQDMVYNNRVSRYALSKMACRYQQALVCGPTGIVSWMFCLTDQAVCGFDFETIYAMNVMPGMQKDVDILISHLDQLSTAN